MGSRIEGTGGKEKKSDLLSGKRLEEIWVIIRIIWLSYNNSKDKMPTHELFGKVQRV